MGRKMIKCAASDLVSVSSTSDAPAQSDDYKEKGRDVLKSEASMEYLCKLPPHRSHFLYLVRKNMILSGHCMYSSYDKI